MNLDSANACKASLVFTVPFFSRIFRYGYGFPVSFIFILVTSNNIMIRIFKYHQELDCFVVDPDYKVIADLLGLTEWNEVVWIGRFFTMDNDVGEHWFDNWDLREPLQAKAKALGLDTTELFILDPDRFKDDRDGPCHSPEERVLFWKDVLLSL